MNKIEQQIWDYLDETCSMQESAQIAQLIKTDPAYQSVYAKFKDLQEDLKNIELDEPSMAFTRNVMDQVKSMPIPGSIRSLIDRRIIYGIAAFFLVSIMILMGFIFGQVDWSGPVTAITPEHKTPQVDFSSYLNNTLIRSFFFADLILGLYMLDSVMRKKLLSNK